MVADTPVPVLKEDLLYIQWWLIHQCLKEDLLYIYSSSSYTSACFKEKSATYTVVAAALVPVLKEDLQKHNSLGITPALLNEQDKSKRGWSTVVFPQHQWQAAEASSFHHFLLPPTWLMSVSHNSVKSLFSLLCKGKRRDGESSEVNLFFLF